jgi:uroporphyrinogen decarboxylase
MPLSSRERVLSVLHHEQPDRVPIVLGVSNATGIKMKPYQGIKKIIGVDAPDDWISNPRLSEREIEPVIRAATTLTPGVPGSRR